MSLPPELRVLCSHFSSTPVAELPRLTPTLLQQVLRCQVPLSSQAGNAAKSDSSASSVLVHKLKTQLSTLLNGKVPEGRFTAVVLIKAVVEVGGWEVLRGSESWVRGLLSVLGKQDSNATKELCIIALTKIYCMTHQYQTLVREITTPTLPTFVTLCLNLISPKPSTKTPEASQTLVETIFQSFALLLPRHTTIYRPFAAQIRLLTKPFLAPTQSDGGYVSPSLKESARRLAVILHQTVAKGGGGEEWGKSFRELVKNTHITADTVFRGVVEDWESTAGYIPESIDVNQEPSGGGRVPEDFPPWSGIDAGIERLTGLLDLLSIYFNVETSTPVAIPLGSVMDLIMRMLSISIPATSESSAERGGPRLHPAIDRDEKDSLWSGLPQVYVAALQLVKAIADRLEENFVSMSPAILAQIAWVFPFGRHSPEFRQMAYTVISKILFQIGKNLNKSQVLNLTSLVRCCCTDLQSGQNTSGGGATTGSERNDNNADAFLPKALKLSEDQGLSENELVVAAAKLLPFFLSHLPQQFLDISLRSLIERAAILTRNKDAMLASVLNPFVGKNGHPLASLVPHLTREYGADAFVEILLRPRMPLVPASGVRSVVDSLNDLVDDDDDDEEMALNADIPSTQTQQQNFPSIDTVNNAFLQGSFTTPLSTAGFSSSAVEPHTVTPTYRAPNVLQPPLLAPTLELAAPPTLAHPPQDTVMAEDPEELEESSDEGSVHLTMQLDSDSDED